MPVNKDAIVAAIKADMNEREQKMLKVLEEGTSKYKCTLVPEVTVLPHESKGNLTIYANPAESMPGLSDKEREEAFSDMIGGAMKELDCMIVPVLVMLPDGAHSVLRPVANKMDLNVG